MKFNSNHQGWENDRETKYLPEQFSQRKSSATELAVRTDVFL